MRWIVFTLATMMAASLFADTAVNLQREIDQEKRKLQSEVEQTDGYKAAAARIDDINRKLDDKNVSDSDRLALAQEKLSLTQELQRQFDAAFDGSSTIADLRKRLTKAKGDKSREAESKKTAQDRQNLLERTYDKFKDTSVVSTGQCKVKHEGTGYGIAEVACVFPGRDLSESNGGAKLAMVFTQDNLMPLFGGAKEARFLVDGKRTAIRIVASETGLGPNGLGSRERVTLAVTSTLVRSLATANEAELQIADENYQIDAPMRGRMRALMDEIDANRSAPATKPADTSGSDV